MNLKVGLRELVGLVPESGTISGIYDLPLSMAMNIISDHRTTSDTVSLLSSTATPSGLTLATWGMTSCSKALWILLRTRALSLSISCQE